MLVFSYTFSRLGFIVPDLMFENNDHKYEKMELLYFVVMTSSSNIYNLPVPISLLWHNRLRMKNKQTWNVITPYELFLSSIPFDSSQKRNELLLPKWPERCLTLSWKTHTVKEFSTLITTHLKESTYNVLKPAFLQLTSQCLSEMMHALWKILIWSRKRILVSL